MATAAAAAPQTGSLMINLFDATRQSVADSVRALVTVYDGWQHTVFDRTVRSSSVQISNLQPFHNSGDDYRVLASAKGFQDTGFFPVHVSAGVNLPVDLMLVPEEGQLNFSQATWKALGASRPALQQLFSQGASAAAAQKRYSDLEDASEGLPLACLLNLTTAMSQIHLPRSTALDYLREVDWTRIAQDRIFAFCDPALIDQVKVATQQGLFQSVPFSLHPGATSSFKQLQFGEANVQLTFHENDRKEIDGKTCILVEPDIDYFRDTASHLVLEVLVNQFGSVTDPRHVYVLRWMAGRHAGVPEFDPLYTIEQA